MRIQNQTKMEERPKKKVLYGRMKKEQDLQELYEKIEKENPIIFSNLNSKWCEVMENNFSANPCVEIDWNNVPGLDPSEGGIEADRAERKRLQLLALASLILENLPLSGNCVEFCAGSGHLGLLVAYLRPSSHVTIVELRERGCNIAKKRAEEANLNNVTVYCGSIQQYAMEKIPFDLGFSLHSCGMLSDWIQEICVSARASYVLCPCCYGHTFKQRSWKCDEMKEKFSAEEYKVVASCADTTVEAKDINFPKKKQFQIAKKAMICVDIDRSFWAQQYQYRTDVKSLLPLHCSPKNDVIIGIPEKDFTCSFEVKFDSSTLSETQLYSTDNVNKNVY